MPAVSIDLNMVRVTNDEFVKKAGEHLQLLDSLISA